VVILEYQGSKHPNVLWEEEQQKCLIMPIILTTSHPMHPSTKSIIAETKTNESTAMM